MKAEFSQALKGWSYYLLLNSNTVKSKSHKWARKMTRRCTLSSFPPSGPWVKPRTWEQVWWWGSGAGHSRTPKTDSNLGDDSPLRWAEENVADSPAGPALTTHLIAGPALVLQGGDEQVGGVRAAPLAPGLRPRLTFGSLLTEDQHRSDALAPVPQPQGRQVPTDHLDLTVQLHLARAAPPRPTTPLWNFPLPARQRRCRGPRPRGLSADPPVCFLCRHLGLSQYSGSMTPANTDGVPSPSQGRILTVAAGWQRADTDSLRTRLAPSLTGVGRGHNVIDPGGARATSDGGCYCFGGRVFVSAVDS